MIETRNENTPIKIEGWLCPICLRAYLELEFENSYDKASDCCKQSENNQE